jgi:radical SAM protein with 4Fe4S-binding SPASM domain
MNIKKIFTRNKWHISNKILSEYNELRGKDKTLFCYAPYNSLTFKPDGSIYVCFDNIRKKLGEYPRNSLAETWNGKEIKKIRKRIARHCLNYGCEECYNQLVLKNYYSVTAWHYDYIRPINKKKDLPTAFDFQLSNICNYECIMCSGELSTSIRSNREHSLIYDCPYDDKFIEQLQPYIPNLQNASFTGGETFLNPLYYKIWDIIAEENPQCIISISTNGSMLDDRIKCYLKKLKCNITISINAVDEDIYKSIHVGGNMENVLNNYMYFKEYCKRAGSRLMIKICPLRQNIYHIPTLMEYFNSNDTCISFNKVMYPPHCSLWNLPSDELGKIIDFLKSNRKEANTQTEKLNLARYDTLINQLNKWQHERIKIEELKLNEKSCIDLMKTFENNLNKYFSSLDIISSEAKTEIYEISEKIRQIAILMNDDCTFKKSIIYLTELPMSFIVPQLKSRTAEMWKNRLEYSFKHCNQN